jgi:hypothetical protein
MHPVRQAVWGKQGPSDMPGTMAEAATCLHHPFSRAASNHAHIQTVRQLSSDANRGFGDAVKAKI